MFKLTRLTNELWVHQRKALRFVIRHLKSSSAPCLVRMPTGTGKSGVIAYLSMKCTSGRTLVLTPWTNLRDQMIHDLTIRFWNKIGIPAPQSTVRELIPSNVKSILSDKTIKVAVASLATLNDLRREHEKSYDDLSNFFDLVIVDEGHYEPAVEWGKSVKGLHKPTVLFTATPYRNDLKLFRISDPAKSVWQFRHCDAETAGIIRTLEFKPLGDDSDLDTMTSAFVTFWKENNELELASAEPRAIICCEDHLSIKKVVASLLTAGIPALGIHERFKRDDINRLFQSVPTSSTNAQVWVHQYKLTEGLDDHRFCCIALFYPIQNDRKLVQQIGRALRKHTSDRANKSAIVLSPEVFDIKKKWEAYLAFEQDAKLITQDHYRNIVESLLHLQPETEYFGGRFKRRFRSNDLSSDQQVTISPSVLIRKAPTDFSLKDYINDCTDTLSLADSIILGTDTFSPCISTGDYALWVYASIKNSRLLEKESFYEISLEAHCVVLCGEHLLISDTAGNYPTDFLEESTSVLPPGTLSNLLDASFRLTNLSINSAIPFDNVVRAADIRGSDIAKIPTSLTDRMQICRSARGASKDSGRRYIGMNRGRVRQELSSKERRQFLLSDFVEWCNNVSVSLQSLTHENLVFQRYMQTCSPPAHLVAKMICLDLVRLDTKLINSDGKGMRALTSSSELNLIPNTKNLYTFSLEFETLMKPHQKIICSLQLEFQSQKKRFWFKKGDTDNTRVELDDINYPSGRSLYDYLNLNQDLVLIGLEGGAIVYQGRDFYKIDYKYAEQALLDRIKRINVAPCNTEKGTKAQLTLAKGGSTAAKRLKQIAFPENSLFRAIHTDTSIVPFPAELLICDDLSSECSDFLAADFKQKKLALLHAKVGDGSKISASAFHEIVAQAIKNLAYLSRNAETPKGARSWSVNNYWNRTAIPRVLRSAPGTPSKTALWKKLKSEIIENVDAELHVILVTSGCCDLDELKKSVADPEKRTFETAQLLHLLEGLNAYARQLGVRLSIIDIPFDNSLILEKQKNRTLKKAQAKTRIK